MARQGRSLDKWLRASLTEYNEEIIKRVDLATVGYARRVMKRVSQTAPRGSRMVKRKFDEGRPHFYQSIAVKYKKAGNVGSAAHFIRGNSTYILYFRPPNNRIAHLLEWGFLVGKRHKRLVEGSHFLDNALAEEYPKFIDDVGDVIKSAPFSYGLVEDY